MRITLAIAHIVVAVNKITKFPKIVLKYASSIDIWEMNFREVCFILACILMGIYLFAKCIHLIAWLSV